MGKDKLSFLYPVIFRCQPGNPFKAGIEGLIVRKAYQRGDIRNFSRCSFQQPAGFLNPQVLYVLGDGAACGFLEEGT